MSKMQWFRLYHEMVDDDKLRLLAFEDRWHFVALCCLKSNGLLDSETGSLRERRVAVKLGVQVRELEEIGRRLFEVGLVDEQLNPVSWDKLQFRADTSTDRVRKYREKQRCNKAKRYRNVSETVQETETDTDTDLEAKASCASGEPDTHALKPEHFAESWNAKAKRYGLPSIRELTPERRTKLKARIAGYSMEDFRAVLAAIDRSPFLQGERGWKGCTFDWITKKGNFQKVLEGNYDG